MSVTKNKTTQYDESPVDVKFVAKWIRFDYLDDIPNVRISGRLSGTVGTAPGERDHKEASIGLAQIKANCTAIEKGKIKATIAIIERELALAEEELNGETHDASDVFVEPAE